MLTIFVCTRTAFVIQNVVRLKPDQLYWWLRPSTSPPLHPLLKIEILWLAQRWALITDNGGPTMWEVCFGTQKWATRASQRLCTAKSKHGHVLSHCDWHLPTSSVPPFLLAQGLFPPSSPSPRLSTITESLISKGQEMTSEAKSLVAH